MVIPAPKKMGRVQKGTAIGLLAVSFIGGWEGVRLYSYRDIIGVWTACYGETKGIGPGMKFTKEQCDDMFIGGIQRHEEGMRKCLKNPDALPMKTYVAALSLTYNIGIGGFCRSTMAKRLNAGDLPGACKALTWYTRAGGKQVKGLVNRRIDGLPGMISEYKLCLQGIEGR